MKRKRFLVEQIVAVLKPAEVWTPVADLICEMGLRYRLFIAGRSCPTSEANPKQNSSFNRQGH